jgi:heme oxygenase
MTSSDNLTARLKDDNWALHQIAERQETPGSLIKGTMPKPGYLAMIAQQYLVNSAFDHTLLQAMQSEPMLSSLIDKEQLLTQYLVEDMHYFKIDPDPIEANPGTQRYIDHIEAHKDQPLHLLGLHYVRLGACNGNTFVARIVRKAYELEDAVLGTRYLDPFGSTQRKKWLAFKTGLDALELTPSQRDEVFDGTRAAYVLSVNLDLAEYKSGEQLLTEHGKDLDQKAFIEGHSVHVTAQSE